MIYGNTVLLDLIASVSFMFQLQEKHSLFSMVLRKRNRKHPPKKSFILEYTKKFGRILAYLIKDNINVSIELAKLGMAQVVVYQHKKPFIYRDKLLKAQDEAKKKKLGIWSK